MLRIMEAIQRKKLIQLLNDEYKQEIENDINENNNNNNNSSSNSNKNDNDISEGIIKLSSPPKVFGKQNIIDYDSIPYITPPLKENKSDNENKKVVLNEEIQRFIKFLEEKLTDLQRKALRITWKRMSEAPRTSSKGMLCIMEKVFDKMISENPEISNVFYRSAFLSCIEDRKISNNLMRGNSSDLTKNRCPYKKKTIATLRDHANILLDFVNTIITQMFDMPYKPTYYYQLTKLGCDHAKLIPLGFDKKWFHKLGECFAEVMFSQECVRAFPHAPGAWSIFAVALTEKLFVECKWKKVDGTSKKQRNTLPSSLSFSEWSDNYPATTITASLPRNIQTSSKSMFQINNSKGVDECNENFIGTSKPTNI
uniref:GLOBIN domain-containing protein n=1 Tax=Parastrongyloides trichosuri TaxID=131310 RepID=A0A0N4Z666_PARTI